MGGITTKRTLFGGKWLGALFGMLLMTALSFPVMSAPSATSLNNQEMATLKGQASIYGHVYYNGSGVSTYVYAWLYPNPHLSALSNSSGYYYLDLGSHPKVVGTWTLYTVYMVDPQSGYGYDDCEWVAIATRQSIQQADLSMPQYDHYCSF